MPATPEEMKRLVDEYARLLAHLVISRDDAHQWHRAPSRQRREGGARRRVKERAI